MSWVGLCPSEVTTIGRSITVSAFVLHKKKKKLTTDVNVVVKEKRGWVHNKYPSRELNNNPGLPDNQPRTLLRVEMTFYIWVIGIYLAFKEVRTKDKDNAYTNGQVLPVNMRKAVYSHNLFVISWPVDTKVEERTK